MKALFLKKLLNRMQIPVTEVAIPWLNKPRTNLRGRININEPQSQKIFVTTAGYQGYLGV